MKKMKTMKTIENQTNSSCRICLAQDEPSKLITPCHCDGSLKWVHRECLAKWMETRSSDYCSICKRRYSKIIYVKIRKNFIDYLCHSSQVFNNFFFHFIPFVIMVICLFLNSFRPLIQFVVSQSMIRNQTLIRNDSIRNLSTLSCIIALVPFILYNFFSLLDICDDYVYWRQFNYRVWIIGQKKDEK